MMAMGSIETIYRPSLALLTDLYQLAMAYGYWKLGRADDEALFHLSFRAQPFGGGFAIACGLGYAIEFVRSLRFDDHDLKYFATLTGHDGSDLFDAAFLRYLGRLEFACDLDAAPEGTVVFAHEPIVRVKGPILQGQILETPLLNMINFQTLAATKAARTPTAGSCASTTNFKRLKSTPRPYPTIVSFSWTPTTRSKVSAVLPAWGRSSKQTAAH